MPCPSFVRILKLTDLVEALTRIRRGGDVPFRHGGAAYPERGWTLGLERKDSYVNELLTFLSKDGSPEAKLVDRLLFSAMIEARSCERFSCSVPRR